ncbi:hypothetical protein EAO69_23525 [Streptomyces sp. me109]|nr:hypothetical protein EAO69_23525 [Streptomyces sp. me109]
MPRPSASSGYAGSFGSRARATTGGSPVRRPARSGRPPTTPCSWRSVRSTPSTREPMVSGASMPNCAASGAPSTASAPPSRTGSHRPPRTSSNAGSPPPGWTRSGAATSHTCKSAGHGCISPASSTSAHAGCSATRWATHMRAELVIDALTMAVATRGGNVTGVIFHADRGAQYTSAAFAQVCDRFGIRRSMGRVGSSYDNALAESFWQGLKRETMHQRMFSTVRQARLEIFQWLTYYNARRRHSALNYLSPAEFEQQHQRGRKLTLAA